MRLTIILILGAVLMTFALLMFRAQRLPLAERRKFFGLDRPIRTGLLLASLFLVPVVVFIAATGLTGIRAMSAARTALRERFGPATRVELLLKHHLQEPNSKAGAYEMSYRYDEKRGLLEVRYAEREGVLKFDVKIH